MSKYGSMRRPASKISTKKQIASVQRSFVRGVLVLFLTTLMIIFIFGDHGLLQLHKLKRERSKIRNHISCLLYTSPSPRDKRQSRMPSSA